MQLLEASLGYKFKRQDLLLQALTHPSVGYENQKAIPDNQRLEFLGDAVLQLTLAERLFAQFCDEGEGLLTKARASLVSARALAAVARDIELGKYLRLGRSEDSNGGRSRESTLSDALEAVVGALFLDGGMEAARGVVDRLFGQLIANLELLPAESNPKGHLQELLQPLGFGPPIYQIVGDSGPDHDKCFSATVEWRGKILGSGQGKTKKAAETEAARSALVSENIENLANNLTDTCEKVREHAIQN